MNLIIVSGALLIFIIGESGCHSALSMSPPRLHHPPITVRELATDSVTLFWFAGAVGLFFRKRLAWVGSLFGVGASVCVLTAFLAAGIGVCLYPTAETEQYICRDQAGGGYIFAYVVTLTQFSILLAICLRLLFGLFQTRKEFSAPL
jgi:hypothetical protein